MKQQKRAVIHDQSPLGCHETGYEVHHSTAKFYATYNACDPSSETTHGQVKLEQTSVFCVGTTSSNLFRILGIFLKKKLIEVGKRARD